MERNIQLQTVKAIGIFAVTLTESLLKDFALSMIKQIERVSNLNVEGVLLSTIFDKAKYDAQSLCIL